MQNSNAFLVLVNRIVLIINREFNVHILLSNDDGYHAPGLAALADALKKHHHQVSIVAPLDNKSGCGMGMSLRKPISVDELSPSRFIVDGTPVDCVYLALDTLIESPVDLVISGINNGANMADDVLYSGTFAAAMEARRLNLPSIAISVASHNVSYYETAAHIATSLASEIHRLEYRSLLSVLNVNVPDVPMSQLRGLKATVSGERLAPVSPNELERDSVTGHRQFLLGAAGEFDRRKQTKLTDFLAVEQGFVSVTPFSDKFESRAYIKDTQSWLDSL